MRTVQQLVIDDPIELEVVRCAIKRYKADLEITVDRFPEMSHGFDTPPGKWLGTRLRDIQYLINRLDGVDDYKIGPAQEEQ